MRATAFDVLLYMFEHYEDLPDDPESSDAVFLADDDPLEQALESEGFGQHEIHIAFKWLDELANQVDPVGDQSRGYELAVNAQALRVFAPQELDLLGDEGIGFLLYLQQANVIDAAQRELIIDRAVALHMDRLSLEQFQWLILMVLVNQPNQEQAYMWLEDLLFSHDTEQAH